MEYVGRSASPPCRSRRDIASREGCRGPPPGQKDCYAPIPNSRRRSTGRPSGDRQVSKESRSLIRSSIRFLHPANSGLSRRSWLSRLQAVARSSSPFRHYAVQPSTRRSRLAEEMCACRPAPGGSFRRLLLIHKPNSDGSGQRLTRQILGSLDLNEDGIAPFSGSLFFSASIRRFQTSS